MTPMLTIAIPTYDNKLQLQTCLSTLFCLTEFPYKVIVIDNGSKGEIKSLVPAHIYDMVTVVEPGTNLGWMKSINLALSMCDTPYFCMMNDDVVFVPGVHNFWRELLSCLVQEGVGASGPGSNFVSGAQLCKDMSYPLLVESPYLIGFCLCIATQLFKTMGGLDESLPGGDDLDLSIRLHKDGYKLLANRNIFLLHEGQQTGRRVHGVHYDSLWSQEVTMNALIKKHGVRAWFELMQSTVKDFIPNIESADTHNWFNSFIRENNLVEGVNVGCGFTAFDNCINVDRIPKGGIAGAGIMRYRGSIADVQADADDLPFDSGSKNFIAASHLLEHVLDPIKTLLEWKRVLKPGGLILVEVPNQEECNTILLDLTHLHAFTKDSLERLILACDFEIKSIEVLPGVVRVVAVSKEG